MERGKSAKKHAKRTNIGGWMGQDPRILGKKAQKNVGNAPIITYDNFYYCKLSGSGAENQEKL